METGKCLIYYGIKSRYVCSHLHYLSPLHNAVLMDNVKLVKRFCTVLSALGKSLDILNKYGETPLHLAIKENKPSIVSELLQRGAAPEVKTLSGDTSFHLAVQNPTSECLAVLTKCASTRLHLNDLNDRGERS